MGDKPRERNKDKSKQQFLDAVAEILTDKGHMALKVNDIAATAGLDKKLVYKYFGGTDGLLDEYIRTQDFWTNVSEDDAEEEITDGGQKFTKQMLLRQFDYVSQNKKLQKILLWSLYEDRNTLKNLVDGQEDNGEVLFKGITDPHFDKRSEDFRAIIAILIAGSYYLSMFPEVNGSSFCGIDLNTIHGRNKIKNALEFLVDKSYENL